MMADNVWRGMELGISLILVGHALTLGITEISQYGSIFSLVFAVITVLVGLALITFLVT